jgi:ABC-type spermidine/putrescine transport system permease subunit II
MVKPRQSSPPCWGPGAALALDRMKPRLRASFDVLVYLSLVIPGIVIAVASLIFFVQARNRWRELGKGGDRG